MAIAEKLLCFAIRYCGCAGQAVIGIWYVEVLLLLLLASLMDSTESDCSMVLSEYCELAQPRLVIHFIQLSAALLA